MWVQILEVQKSHETVGRPLDQCYLRKGDPGKLNSVLSEDGKSGKGGVGCSPFESQKLLQDCDSQIHSVGSSYLSLLLS